jgi:pimeloyl-ACP methyl ester carboxylesterase
MPRGATDVPANGDNPLSPAAAAPASVDNEDDPSTTMPSRERHPTATGAAREVHRPCGDVGSPPSPAGAAHPVGRRRTTATTTTTTRISSLVAPPPPPPLGLTGVICQTGQLKIAGRGILTYTVYRPRLLLRVTTKSTTTTTTKNRVMMNAGCRGGGGIIATSSFRPPPLPPTPPPPLVCVAGGPSGLSSTYLSVLVHGIIDRAVILYDHMGSGQSLFKDEQPQQQQQLLSSPRGGGLRQRQQRQQRPASSHYPRLEDAITDLRALLVHLFGNNNNNTTNKFHLLGHSYGGLVAFECIKRYYNNSSGATSSASSSSAQDDNDGGPAAADARAGHNEDANDEHLSEAAAATAGGGAIICQSLILANVPHDVAATLSRRRQLQAQLLDDFMSTHECRVVPVPLPLRQSLESRRLLASGDASRHSYDSRCRHHHSDDDDDDDDDDIEDNNDVDNDGDRGDGGDDNDDVYYKTYVVHGEISPSIPTALLFGEYDFVESSLSSELAWRLACPHHRVFHLAGCSHYAMIENDTLFNSTVMNFLQDHDDDDERTMKGR